MDMDRKSNALSSQGNYDEAIKAAIKPELNHSREWAWNIWLLRRAELRLG